MSDEREPTQDELDAMAYVDLELAPLARRAFEERLARELGLAREVAVLRRLNVLARHAAGTEPMDTEWARQGFPAQRAVRFLAWILVLAGALGLCAWGLFEIETADIGLLPKLCVAALVLGFALFIARAACAQGDRAVTIRTRT